MLITLQQLQSGCITPESLGPAKRIQIAEGLTEFPRELFELADHVEVLDMSGNNLMDLPPDFARFKKLRILFLSNNQFDHIPPVIADCPELEMIGFKSNQIKTISEDGLPLKTRWLILTDNQLSELPCSMGRLNRLQKLALAGNQLTSLPDSMADCHRLELIRLSANNFQAMPDWLFQLPKLAWLAFSGNPCTKNTQAELDTQSTQLNPNLPEVKLNQIQLLEQIGIGASGVIHKASWQQNQIAAQTLTKQQTSAGQADDHIAVKLFKGSITSDGYPQDELDCCLTAGEHNNLIKVIGFMPDPKQLGLLMELIPNTYSNLGLPPSLVTCTRDTFEQDTQLNMDYVLTVIRQMASTIQHLHAQGISHGDIYAHNILVNQEADILFGDFGAATQLSSLPEYQQLAMEKIEVRALGNLVEDLLLNIDTNLSNGHQQVLDTLNVLVGQCRSNHADLPMGIDVVIKHLQNIG